MTWKITDENGLCILILTKNTGWYLGVIGKLDNYECLMYILIGKVENGTPIISNKKLHNCWYKELRNPFHLY